MDKNKIWEFGDIAYIIEPVGGKLYHEFRVGEEVVCTGRAGICGTLSEWVNESGQTQILYNDYLSEEDPNELKEDDKMNNNKIWQIGDTAHVTSNGGGNCRHYYEIGDLITCIDKKPDHSGCLQWKDDYGLVQWLPPAFVEKVTPENKESGKKWKAGDVAYVSEPDVDGLVHFFGVGDKVTHNGVCRTGCAAAQWVDESGLIQWLLPNQVTPDNPAQGAGGGWQKGDVGYLASSVGCPYHDFKLGEKITFVSEFVWGVDATLWENDEGKTAWLPSSQVSRKKPEGIFGSVETETLMKVFEFRSGGEEVFNQKQEEVSYNELLQGGWVCFDISKECADAFNNIGLAVWRKVGWGYDGVNSGCILDVDNRVVRTSAERVVELIKKGYKIIFLRDGLFYYA